MKQVYCTVCGHVNNIDDNQKYCYNCGKELINFDKDKVSLAEKYIDKKGGIIAATIILNVVLMGVGIACLFFPKRLIYDFLIILGDACLCGLLDWLIIYDYKKTSNYPNEVIYFNEKLRSLEVYSKKQYRIIALETIDKLVVHDIIFVSTGKAVVPIKVKYGTITFKLCNGTKITSIQMNNVQQVKDKIEELRIL